MTDGVAEPPRRMSARPPRPPRSAVDPATGRAVPAKARPPRVDGAARAAKGKPTPASAPRSTGPDAAAPAPRSLPPKKRSASPRTRTHAGAAASATLSATAVVDAPPEITAPEITPPNITSPKVDDVAPADPDQTIDLRRLTPREADPSEKPSTEPSTEPTTVVPVTTEPATTPGVADDTEALMRREVQPARPLRMVQTRTRPRVRRVTRIVRHVDPWSVFKVALVFSAFLYGVCLTAGVLLWRVASDTGTIDNIENFFEETGWETFELKGGEIYHQAWIAGLFVAVGLVGFAVLIATLFNLVTDLVGGVRVSVLEEEVVARGERPLKRKDLRTMRRQARKMQRRPAAQPAAHQSADGTESQPADSATPAAEPATETATETATEPTVEMPAEAATEQGTDDAAAPSEPVSTAGQPG